MINNYRSKGLLALAVLLSSTNLFAQKGEPVEGQKFPVEPSFTQFDAKSRPQLSQAGATLRNVLNLKAEDDFRKTKAEVDQLGFTHEKHQQYYRGVKVEYGTYIVHAKGGAIESVNGEFHNIKDLDVTPTLSEREALTSAIKHVGATSYMWQDPAEEAELKNSTGSSKATYFPKGELVIVQNTVANDGSYSVAYKFDIYAQAPISRAYIYVNARSGEVVHTNAIIKHANATGSAATRYSGTRTITTDSYNGSFRLREGVGAASTVRRIETYNMRQGTNYSRAVDFTDLNNSWIEYNNTTKDNAALDAHWGAEMTYDYWKNVHSRNSYNNVGAIIKSYVHYSRSYDNAFWDGQRMTYGDGSGVGGFNALTSLDVAAHEIGHAVCTNTANLTYSYESGALNEGFSDIWAACVEAYAAPEKKIWLIGEDIEMRSGHVSLRSMENPNIEGQPDTYKGTYWYTGTGDNGGVHYNSGVLNHWFYILTVGKSGSNDLGNSFSVTGLGIDKAAKIAYRTESLYLTSSSNYAAARTGAIQSAIDLYGAGSAEVIATTNAWYAVGVGAAYAPAAVAGQVEATKATAQASARVEAGTSLKLGVYPNPASDVLNIALPELTEGATVKISSISGAEVYSATINGRSHEVKVAGFNAGIYVVTVKDKNGVATHKFVKQ